MTKKLTSKKTSKPIESKSSSTKSSSPSVEKSSIPRRGTAAYGAYAAGVQASRTADYEKMAGPQKAARAAAVEALKQKMIAAGRYTEGEPEIPIMSSPYKFLNVTTAGKPFMSKAKGAKPSTFKRMMSRILQGLISGARGAESVIAGSHLNVSEPKASTLEPPIGFKPKK